MADDALDFAVEIDRMLNDPCADAGGVAIWGGTFESRDLERFLASWSLASMPYRIWEYPGDIVFTRDALPDAGGISSLERGRIFGFGGDLSLRRDSDRYHWHFIGQPNTAPPAGFVLQDFWTDSPEGQRPDFKLRQQRDTALLWGAYRSDLKSWQDDRVGWAILNYPVSALPAEPDDKRIQLNYTLFTDGGQVAFVWLQELAEYA
jgi:hypothetical protein